MTIPAGDNWCPDCREACHDHARICTVCGATLTAPPAPAPTPTAAPTTAAASSSSSVRLVPESLTDEIRTASQELSALLRHTRTQIRQVGAEQDLLQQQLASASEEWQVAPAALLDPQQNNGNNNYNKPTSAAVLAALPRVRLTAHSPIFHQSTVEWRRPPPPRPQDGTDIATDNTTTTFHRIEAIPGEFGAHAVQPRIHIGPAVLVVADPLTGAGGRGGGGQQQQQPQPQLSETTRQAIANAMNTQRQRVILYLQRGDNVTFVEKARLAQDAGAAACIVGNHLSAPWPYTMKDGKGQATELNLEIPVVMVSKENGQEIVAASRSTTTTTNSTLECMLTIHQKNNNDDNSGCCCVCTEAWAVGHTVVTLPSCGHAFHERCATTWLQQHNTCPYCRAELPLQDDELERERQRQRNTGTESVAAAFYG